MGANAYRHVDRGYVSREVGDDQDLAALISGIDETWTEFERRFHESVSDQIEAFVQRRIWPFFRRRRYKMLVGNGTFLILDRNEKHLAGGYTAHDDVQRLMARDPDFAEVLLILDSGVPGFEFNSLGSLAPDYPPNRTS